MNKLVATIGSLAIAILFISIPMLTIVSFINNWYGLIKLILCIATLMETATIATFVFERSEE